MTKYKNHLFESIRELSRQRSITRPRDSFLKKNNNKKDSPLRRFTEEKEKTFITCIRNETGDITTDHRGIKKIIEGGHLAGSVTQSM